MKSYLLAGSLLLVVFSCRNKLPDPNNRLICIKGTFNLQTILRKIEDQTGKRFFYANSDFDDQQTMTVDWNNLPLSEVLAGLLKEKKLHWNAKEKIVALCADTAK
ncbi:hypothetical protein GO495_12730 [Chitinophaga oryziterrae]|uniref:DUF4974 domain-containing protein n=1 Tax=Chitinophaga oryziterrae TaxID=1031224 RepID=A0A6N8J909_9BACT|nr:STN domain-containing protein [Chitinophaga oryziterrae]MVT41454.1 hypothetical protein [Chitinophaga oryziterrae]